ncbi:hypothetical protein CONPUDRAFT_45986 [Coniophora puteana RWD-64-598 SS2]|uniref:Spindle pole body component n=1 Tax=Coniophora puteana (strain RWD-64-598) TaxID=741705 RepID=A0A5M3N916_CONPW|nr:uncharacterized protein CONPUDRAFT_45986 [Coniophora puteana RWD-64-598 SS2]EIW87341.1 hypothetical protein CONPUDRAFT_45986 [Coniophora puteana RWD-64-598 SS2]
MNDPFTPHGRPGRKKHLGLSNKEYTKITGTIASVRRNRQGGPEDEEEEEAAFDFRQNKLSEPSFIAETSFVRAPLNSRVGASQSKTKDKGKGRVEPLDVLPVDIQEALILEDLLFVLMGIEGTYITYHPDYSAEDDDPLMGVRFAVSSALDISLRDLTERILPLGTYYTAISSFIESRSHLDYGLVNHALCASIRDMLREYQTLLSQLEHAFNTSPNFSLQKLWYHVHPTMHALSLIYALVLELAFPESDDADASASSSDSEEDPELAARNAALGLGSAALKAVLSDITHPHRSAEVVPVKGGEVLAVVHDRLEHLAGDPSAKAVYGALLRAAGAPYVRMLRGWITSGRLEDPYEELCVKESRFISRGILEVDYTDEYWERRYTLRDGSTSAKRQQAGIPVPRTEGGRLPGGACIPPVLEGWKHKILLAGKYLNVIRECGIEVQTSEALEKAGELEMADDKLYKYIEDAYTHANRTLLARLLAPDALVPRLRCLRRVFFLAQSSFLTHFLDLAGSELRKPAKSASLVKMQSLLDLALAGYGGGEGGQGDDGSGGMYKEDVKVTLASNALYEWLLNVINVSGVIVGETGEGDGDGGVGEEHQKKEKEKEKDDKKNILAIDALSLDYHVPFPLSLVISRKTILRYQLIFRFLLHLKHVEQSLTAMWVEQKTLPWKKRMPASTPYIEFEAWRLRVALLRARMLGFVQQILAFATFEVLEPNWRKMEAKLSKVATVDQLMRDHVDFLDTCLKECMLTSAKLLRAYSRMIVTCSTFALYTSSFTKSANQAIAAAEAGDGDQAMNKRWDFLKKFESNFDHWFKFHLDCVQYYASSENVSLLPLVVRLNSIKPSSQP